MGEKPRLLDLFCGAGGASVGYHRAGFEVVGVDIAPQPHYPFEFHRADALKVLDTFLRTQGQWNDPWDPKYELSDFAAIHTSPPCQFHSTLSNRWRGKGGVADTRVNLLSPTLKILRRMDIPWVVENVEGASSFMQSTLKLHGGMFGLRVHRPRLFESNILLLAPREPVERIPVGVYGRAPDGRYLSKSNRLQRAASSLAEAQEAMGMDWADWHGTKEAIPPAYTQFIGEQLMAHLKVTA